MKSIAFFFATVLTLLFSISPGKAQSILFQQASVGPTSDGTISIPFTTTQTGPLILQAIASGGATNQQTFSYDYALDGNGISGTSGSGKTSFSINVLTQISNLAPGTHTLTFHISTGNQANPATASTKNLLILPNEPPSGVQAAIDQINSEITQNTSDITTLQNEITTIQATLQNQSSQIASLQAAETADVNAISALQSQLQTIETTLQNEITQDEANISALQAGQSNQDAEIATLQQQVSQLQNQIAVLQSEIAALPSAPAGSSSNSQYTDLQNQINSLKKTNKNQWIVLGGVGLLGATGTAIGAYELSQEGNDGNNSQVPNATSHKTSGSYNPYQTNISAYSKKN